MSYDRLQRSGHKRSGGRGNRAGATGWAGWVGCQALTWAVGAAGGWTRAGRDGAGARRAMCALCGHVCHSLAVVPALLAGWSLCGLHSVNDCSQQSGTPPGRGHQLVPGSSGKMCLLVHRPFHKLRHGSTVVATSRVPRRGPSCTQDATRCAKRSTTVGRSLAAPQALEDPPGWPPMPIPGPPNLGPPIGPPPIGTGPGVAP